MAVLRIRKYGDPILRQKTKTLEAFDGRLRQMTADMIETMQAASGIGLAANQVGWSDALCVVDMGLVDESAQPRAFVNPVIVQADKNTAPHEEGCLSIPEVTDQVVRPQRIRVKFQDLEGAPHEEDFEGMIARVLQHEIDHLNGTFFVDRLSPVRRQLHHKKLKEIAEQAQIELLEEKKKKKARVKIVFMGTPEFALPSLRKLLEHGAQVAAVVTGMDKPAGRGLRVIENPVKRFAQAAGLPVLQPDKLNAPAFLAALQQFGADLFLVVAFRILPQPVFTIPPRGTVNLHAALLPKYRGAAPVQWAIINGETETGVTTFLIDEKMDTGALLLQRRTAIGENETAGELHDRLAAMGAELLLETVIQLSAGRLQSQPQQGESSRAPKITKEMAQIDWRKPARAVRNFVRGMNPVPGAFTHWQGKTLKIFAGEVHEARAPASAPGEICLVDAAQGELWIQTGEGALAIRELQLQGKRRMSTAEFLRGHAIAVQEVLR